MWDLIPLKGAPTRQRRWCCDLFKENSTPGRMVATGVRWDESAKRSNREEFEALGKTIKDKKQATYSDLILNNDNDSRRNIIDRCEIKGAVVSNPIIDWKHQDIWDYIRSEGIEYNPLYDMGYSRVGCIGCPMSSYKKRCKEFADFPKYKENYIKAFDKAIKIRGVDRFKDGIEMFDWWNEDPKMQGQVSLFEEE